MNSAAPAAARPGLRQPALPWLVAEFAALYIAFPLALATGLLPRNPIPSLVGGAALLVWLLRRDPSFDRARLWNWTAARPELRHVLTRAAVIVAAGLIALALRRPDLILTFPRRAPALWMLVVVLYPALSVYPQEVIFRAFLFHRYRRLFPSENARVAASALAFGLAHVLFGNALAVVLSALGGFLFARTYAHSRSLALVSIEHAVLGDAIFTLGLGAFFYHGSA